MNIRVDLNTPINDGTEVVFRSPVDCSQVTGLIVYYDGGSQEFMFADAHGNNVGDIDHLFAEDVAVKVILDVTKGMAFVQNADTNAYLEGRFAELPGRVTEEGGVILTDCDSKHRAAKGAVSTGFRIGKSGAEYETDENGDFVYDENGEPIILDENDWRYNEAIGTGSIAAGMGAVAFSRASKSLGYRTQTGYPPSAEHKAARPEALLITISGEFPKENIGQAAVAIGADTAALGNHSFAGGYLSIASGMNSFAFGDNGCKATGSDAVALGCGSKATGEHSFAMGHSVEATGSMSVALGYLTKAIGVRSIAGGYGESGEGLDAKGDNSFSFGVRTHANGGTSVALGHESKANGNTSFACGLRSQADGDFSFAAGNATKANAASSTAFGITSQATGYGSMATGSGTVAAGKYSLTAGWQTRTHKDAVDGQVAFGKYNAEEPNALFIIGNGTSDTDRKNAFEVTKDGGIILRSPNGTRFKITVSDDGILTTERYQ